MTDPPSISDLPWADQLRIDAICDEFESARQAVGGDRIEDHIVDAAGDYRRILITALVELDVAYRVQAGESPAAADYCQRFPEIDTSKISFPGSDSTGHSRGEDAPLIDDPAETNAHKPDNSECSVPDLPGFIILDTLGRGGMGVVYLARQEKLERLVAIKMIRTGRTGERERSRFKAEAEAVARLQHPNIVQVFAVGDHRGEPYCVLEYVPGGGLDRRLRQAVMSPMAAARFIEQLALALASVHRLQLVHRDLKPANVLVHSSSDAPPESWIPKVSDFGLAKFLDSDSGLTQTGEMFGSPSYMAPEQADGRAGEVTHLADVWALGGILYECLTGKPPFRGENVAETLALVLGEEPDSPVRLRPGLSPDLEAVCLKCLEKEPARRYASAEALAADLHRFQVGEPTTARSPTVVTRLWKWARRKPAKAAAYALLSLALVLGGLGAGAARLWQLAEAALDGERKALGREAELRRELADQSYLGNVDLAHRAWRDNDVLRALRLLNEPDPKLRQWEWRYVARLCRTELRTNRFAAFVADLGLSPDENRFVAAVQDNTARVHDVATGRELLVYRDHSAKLHRAVFHPDGRRVITSAGDGTLRIWEADTGRTLHILQGKSAIRYALATSRDGAMLAAGNDKGIIQLWEPDGGKALGELPADGLVLDLSFSADGTRLYSTGESSQLQMWDVAAKKLVASVPNEAMTYGVAVSPDGTHMAFGDEDGHVFLRAHAATAEATRLADRQQLTDHGGRVCAIRFSPDQLQMLTCSLDQTFRIWNLQTRQIERVFRGHTNDVNAGWFLDGGNRILTCGDRTVRLWDATRDPEALILTGRGKLESVAFSRDNRFVAGTSAAGLFVWDAITGKPIGQWGTEPGASERAIAFDPKGEFVAGAGRKGHIHLWPLTGGPAQVLTGHSNSIQAIAIAPTGDRIASVDDHGRLIVWNRTGRQQLWSVAAHKGVANDVAFSPDGSFLATCGDDRLVRLWNAATGQEKSSFAGHTYHVVRLAFSPDGSRLASASNDNTTKIWSLESGHELITLKAHAHYISGIAFSPDGLRLADAAGDKTIKLYDVRSGKEALTLTGHKGWATGVAFSPDGSRLASCSHDGTVRIWEAPLDATATLPPEADEPLKPD